MCCLYSSGIMTVCITVVIRREFLFLFGDFWKEKVLASFILRSLSLEILWNNTSLMSYMIIVLPLYLFIYIYIPVYNSKGSYSWEGSYLGGGLTYISCNNIVYLIRCHSVQSLCHSGVLLRVPSGYFCSYLDFLLAK